MDLREPDRARFVDLNRTRLRLWEWGDERAPAIVCAHGAHDHGRMWDELAPRLAELGFRVVAADLRGHGDSGGLSSGHTWMASALDLALLARQLDPPVGLLGHSFGGGQVLYVAAVWPELVRWVVSIDGLGPPTVAFAEGDIAEAAAAGLAGLERVMSGPRRPYRTLAEMADRRQKINVRLSPEWIEHLVKHAAVATEGGFTWKGDPMFSVGLPADFSVEHLNAQHELVQCPVLVLTGDQHDTWSEMTADEIKARMGHLHTARHCVIHGAGHYVHVEKPDAVLAEIASFLGEVAGVH